MQHMAKRAENRERSALWSGVMTGFASPMNLLMPQRRPMRRFDPSAERAWSDVGRVLAEASAKEGSAIGKTSNSSLKRKSKARA